MCITFKIKPGKQISAEDIVVYKILKIKENYELISPIIPVSTRRKLQEKYNKDFGEEHILKMLGRTVTWCINETKEYKLGNIIIGNDGFHTSSGLYSYASRECICKHGKSYKEFKAIIPKGSEYYTDGKQYCSNKLKICV